MIEKKCICRNVGICSLANNETVQTIVGEDIVELHCSECGEIAEEYVEEKQKPKPKKGNAPMKIIIGAIVLLLLGVLVYFVVFADTNDQLVEPELTAEKQDISPVDRTQIVAIETIELSASSLKLLVGESEKLSFTVKPQEASAKRLEWNSDKRSVATVDSNGEVKAVAVGEALITVKERGQVLASCNVEIKASAQEKDNQPKGNKIATGTWTGGSKNGKPNGANITFTFTVSSLIDKRDPKQRVANVGDYIIGEYVDGHLVHGRWYKKTGGFESIIIGQP